MSRAIGGFRIIDRGAGVKKKYIIELFLFPAIILDLSVNIMLLKPCLFLLQETESNFYVNFRVKNKSIP